MAQSNTISGKNKATIDRVEVTSELLTGRAGLILFVRYFRALQISAQIETFFGSMRINRKGKPIVEIFKQILCFFIDGSSRHLVRFNALQKDAGYAAAIETVPEQMLSSHGVKRFFNRFWWPRIYLFRHLLQRLFIWRLAIEQPKMIMLGLDTMVMDNDEAKVRHGVRPTYKKVCGFQPLQMTWNRFIIDAVFRRGDAHSNNADTAEKMVEHIVGRIRKKYRADVPIVIRLDSGFFDQALFKTFEKIGIGYVCGGKLYQDIKDWAGQTSKEFWGRYSRQEQVWEYVDFGDRRGNWDKYRRAIFCRPLYKDKQMLLDFARPDTILYTNLGMGQSIDQKLLDCGNGALLDPGRIIQTYHGRGGDELVHRALKDFGFEELPFKRFAPNAAFYYMMLVSFFLYETFKQDVCADVVPACCYATTLRRRIIDIAAKIVRHSGQVILKLTAATIQELNFTELWKRSVAPPAYTAA